MQVTSKGQVTIPQNIREKYGITFLSEVDFVDENGRVYLVKNPNNSRAKKRFENIRGIIISSLTTDEIMKLTRG